MTKTRRILRRGGDGTNHLSLLFGSSDLVWLGSVRRDASWRIGAKDILAVLHMQYHKITEAHVNSGHPIPIPVNPNKRDSFSLQPPLLFHCKAPGYTCLKLV